MNLTEVPLEVLIGEIKRRRNLIEMLDMPEMSTERSSDVQAVLSAVCTEWDISKEGLFADSRRKAITDPRQAAMVIMRSHLLMTFEAVGEVFRKDYGTVIHARQTHDQRMGNTNFHARYSRALNTVKKHQLEGAGCLVSVS